MRRAYKLPSGFPSEASILDMHGVRMTVSLVPDGIDYAIQRIVQVWYPKHVDGGPSLWASIGRSAWIRIRESRQQVWIQSSRTPSGGTLRLHEWTEARERVDGPAKTPGEAIEDGTIQASSMDELAQPKPDARSILSKLPPIDSTGLVGREFIAKVSHLAPSAAYLRSPHAAVADGTGPLSFIESIQEIPVQDTKPGAVERPFYLIRLYQRGYTIQFGNGHDILALYRIAEAEIKAGTNHIVVVARYGNDGTLLECYTKLGDL